MCAGSHSIPPRLLRPLVGAVVLIILCASALPALAADPRLEEAERAAQEALGRREEVLERLYAMDAERESIEARLAELEECIRSQGELATEADAESLRRARDLYMQRSSDPGIAVLTSDSPEEAVEQARFLSFLARNSRGVEEGATASKVQCETATDQVDYEMQQLQARLAEVEAARAEAERVVAETEAAIEEVQRILEQEEAARRAAEEAAAAAARRASSGGSSGGGGGGGGGPAAPPAPVNGDIACPIGTPREYRDTYGAPRSGGRSHMGVDILSPMRTPIYAYENGVVTRMNSNSLGGISLYLDGDSGNLYYYTHLSGYVSGINAGDRVTVGQHIAYNGMTGNAPVAHLHFEVKPGGGSNVNPYPYAVRACG